MKEIINPKEVIEKRIAETMKQHYMPRCYLNDSRIMRSVYILTTNSVVDGTMHL